MPSASFEVHQRLDCKGLNCPLPVLKTKKALDGMAPGQVLEMTATDPGSKPDMEAFSRRTGHELVQATEQNGVFTFYIRKAAAK
ncbi:MAG: sulfurtransferase TusA family protein [Nitrospirota bacterium]